MEHMDSMAPLMNGSLLVFVVGSILVAMALIRSFLPDHPMRQRTTPLLTLAQHFTMIPTPDTPHLAGIHCRHCQQPVATLDRQTTPAPPPPDPTLARPWVVQTTMGWWIQPDAAASRFVAVTEEHLTAALQCHHACPSPDAHAVLDQQHREV